jgi:hypothetical protein
LFEELWQKSLPLTPAVAEGRLVEILGSTNPFFLFAKKQTTQAINLMVDETV